jgi:type I restriction enzyme, S subunit
MLFRVLDSNNHLNFAAMRRPVKMAIWSTVSFKATQEAERFDAEHFDPDDLTLIQKLLRHGGMRLGQVCEKILNGRTPSFYSDDGDDIVVRSGDLTAPLIYPSSNHDFLRTKHLRSVVRLKVGDVLISSIGMGSIGKVSLVMDARNLITVSEVTILRDSSVAPQFLFAYLRSEAGQRQINREITGATGQQHLLKNKVARIVIPPPSDALCVELRLLLSQVWEEEKSVAARYAEAARIVLDALPDRSTKRVTSRVG